MLIQLEVKHLRNARYQSISDCPIAKALKSLGYTKVNIGGTFGRANKNGKRYDFDICARYSDIQNAIDTLTPITVSLPGLE